MREKDRMESSKFRNDEMRVQSYNAERGRPLPDFFFLTFAFKIPSFPHHQKKELLHFLVDIYIYM